MILIDRVYKRFGVHQALDGVSLRIEPGQIFGIIGPNGAGKSTLFRLICQLIRPDSGTITVFGETSELAIKRRIGYLPEEHRLYEHLRTLHYLEHFCLLQGLPRARAREVLEGVGLVHKESERISQLSKGMRQKVAFARTLLADPPVLILDEPTYGLDPHTSQEMRRWIVAAATGKIVVMSSHNLHEAERICDQVAILHRGAVAAQGSPRVLVQQLKAVHLLEVGFRGPRMVMEQVLQSLDARGTPLVDPPGWESDAVRLSFDARLDPFQLLQRVVEAVQPAAGQLALTGITPREPTLEDVFLRVTGQSFSAADEARSLPRDDRSVPETEAEKGQGG